MPPSICQGTNANGSPCGRRSSHKTDGIHFCLTHARVYARDNPSTRLVFVDSLNSHCAMSILARMRTEEGKKCLDRMILELLVTRRVFNPAENLNKFIAGGVAEELMTELISTLGFPVENISAISNIVDIRVTFEGKSVEFSLKNSGGIDQQPILENYRGDTRTEIRPLPPTFILYTEAKCKRARIVYLDHDILRTAFPGLTDEEFHAKVYNRGDSSLTFKSGLLRDLIPSLPEEYIATATYPEEIPEVPPMSITRLALDYVRSQMA